MIEIPETKRGDAKTGSVKKFERFDPTGRHVPRLPIGIKNIGAMIPVEVADRQIAYSGAAFIDLFPGRGAAPGNDPIKTVGCENVRAPIAVKITEQEIINPVGLCVEESPLGLARRGVVPGCAGGQEQIIFAVAVEIAYAEAVGGIEDFELIIPYTESVNSIPALGAANRITVFVFFVVTLE